MDELLHHCIRELAFEGDLGCDASRLRNFIVDFHEHQGAPQTVDDAYCAFVWSVVAQHPEVRVGTVPEGSVEVPIAPRQRQKEKGAEQEKGSKKSKGPSKAKEDDAAVVQLQLIPDAALRSLDELKEEYGDALRIAVSPERSLVAITGSHFRPSKLTPPVYTSLQLISRGRYDGLSVVDLSKKTGYDSKTCFHFVKQLLDLDLIVKLQKAGVGSNFCIHKYFFNRSPVWQKIQAEAQAVSQKKSDDGLAAEEDDDDDDGAAAGPMQFGKLTEEHLSQLPIIRSRVETLLKNSPHNMHKTLNLLITIGFPNPTKTQRRFFTSRLRELEGDLVETVQVRGKSGKLVKCIRLLKQDKRDAGEASTEEAIGELEYPQAALKTNVSLQKQMLDIIDASGTEGTTTNHITDALCNFDKRVMEFQLNRLSDIPPPPHLRDFAITQLTEQHGKQRQYKYFTIPHFVEVAERDELPMPKGDISLDRVKEYMAVEAGQFYKDYAEFSEYVDTIKATEGNSASAKFKTPKKKGRPLKASTGEQSQRGKKRKRDEDAEDAPAESASAPPKKRGRPRKLPLPEDVDGEAGSASAPAAPKKRGRPRKHPLPEAAEGAEGGEGGSVSAPVVPKKRGRPRKHPLPETTEAGNEEGTSVSAPAAPKKRGRPRKHPLPEAMDVDGGDGETASSPPAALADASITEDAPAEADAQQDGTSDDVQVPESASASVVKKKRGRPSKKDLEERAVAAAVAASAAVTTSVPPTREASASADPVEESASAAEAPPKRGRGRPRKVQQQEEPASTPKRRGQPRGKKSQDVVLEPEEAAPDEEVALAKAEMFEAGSVSIDGVVPAVEADEAPGPDQAEESAVAEGAAEEVAAASGSAAMEVDSLQDVGSVVTHDEPADPAVETVKGAPGKSPDEHLEATDAATAPIAIDPILLEAEGSESRQPELTSEPIVLESASTPTVATSGPSKRPQPDTPLEEPSAKRWKTEASNRGRTNITQARRQKEILQVLQNLGGIANTSVKEFSDEHAAVVDALIAAGEPTSSSAGSRLDKRTMTATLNELEAQGKIKLLTTSLTSSTGVTRPVKVAYLADTPVEDLNAFLANISRTQTVVSQPSIKVLEEVVEYGGSRRTKKPGRSSAAEISLDNAREYVPEGTPKPVPADSAAAKEQLHAEPNTVRQEYGFVVGTIARAKILHLHLLNIFDEQVPLDSIVSYEQRILKLSYFFQDIPLSTFAAIMPGRVHRDEVHELLSTPEGRQTPMREASQAVQEAFELNTPRTRDRMLDNLDRLKRLYLAVSLQASEAEQPLIRCAPNGEHPTAFEPTTSDKPEYWALTRTAAMHLWALSKTDPPFYRHTLVSTTAEAEEFWEELQRVSLDAAHCEKVQEEQASSDALQANLPTEAPSDIGRALRRPAEWRASYAFSTPQESYMRHHINLKTADTPLQDPDGGAARLSDIAAVVRAPTDDVARWYAGEHKKLRRLLERRRKKKEASGRRAEAAKASLAQKAAAARAEREAAWDALVARVHPEPLKGTLASRVRAIRARFLQSAGRDEERWEAEVRAAVQEARFPAKRAGAAKPLAPVPRHPQPTPPPLALGAHEKSIEELMAMQGPRAAPEPKTKQKKKGKEKESEADADKLGRRRGRVQWNKDLDELARDASAIIRARCRDGKRLDWEALEQVFTFQRNSVRQRIGHLREQPGADAYLKRLEDRWYELWMRHMGTPELPDDDPGSPSNFNLKAHLEFLRSHIDKNALRVGFQEAEQTLKAVLPPSVEALHARWEVVDRPLAAPTWDFMWTGPSEGGRERQFIQRAVLLEDPELPELKAYSSESVYVADGALKMTLGTPSEFYFVDKATHLLNAAGSSAVKEAMHDLQERGVISQRNRDPKKSKPGRTLKISDGNQNALCGPVSAEIFQDAAALEELLSQREDSTSWREWSLLASDGDLAALIKLTSEGKVDFTVDTSHAKSVRPALDWNSKIADDDDIETAISVRMSAAAPPPPASPAPQDAAMDEEVADISKDISSKGHGRTADGEQASCAFSSAGVVDCAACLTTATSSLLENAGAEETPILQELLDALGDAGPEGITKPELQSMKRRLGWATLAPQLARLTEANVPLAFWTGYKEIVLVSSQYAGAWSVVIEQDEQKCVRVFPRRWLDITGRVMSEVWTAACRAVVGTIVFHPNISQAELRWRLRAVYDRQEVQDVLQYLLDEGYVQRLKRCMSELGDEGPPSNVEEKLVFWSTNSDKAWYQV